MSQGGRPGSNVDPWINLDGRLAASDGVPQFPALLNPYPTGNNARQNWPNVIAAQPPWRVAGVDYRVGLPAGVVLVDWQTIDGATGANPIPGVTVSGNTVTVADNTTINNVDFSLHNGAFLNINGASNIAVRRSKFAWGLNFMSNQASSLINMSGTNITFEYCDIDGSAGAFSSTVVSTGITAAAGTTLNIPTPAWVVNTIDISVYNLTQDRNVYNGPHGDLATTVNSFTGSTIVTADGAQTDGLGGNPVASGDTLIISGIPHQSTLLTGQNSTIAGNIVVRYNYFHDWNQHVVEWAWTSGAQPSIVWKYNLSKDGASASAGRGATGPHLNYMQWGSVLSDLGNCVVQFNTGWQSAEFHSGGEGYQGYPNSGAPAPGGDFGYYTGIFSPNGSGIPHLTGGKNWRVHNNYIDKKGNVSYFYAESLPSVTGNTYNDNVDMTNGRVFGLS